MWEYEIIEGLYGVGSKLTVCVAHMRFAPCRSCSKVEKANWSSSPADVQLVRDQQRKA